MVYRVKWGIFGMDSKFLSLLVKIWVVFVLGVLKVSLVMFVELLKSKMIFRDSWFVVFIFILNCWVLYRGIIIVVVFISSKVLFVVVFSKVIVVISKNWV